MDMMIKPYVLPSIEWNYEEVKAELTNQLSFYDGVVYTDDTIKDAKDDRAKLNKLDKALNDKRKELKASYTAPFDVFEKQVKELSGMIQTVNGKIDAQVKTYEAGKKEEKRKAIVELIKDVWTCELHPTSNEKWLNATYKMDDIRKELEEEQESINYDLDAIRNMNVSEERRNALITKYNETRSIRDVIVYNKQLASMEKPEAVEPKDTVPEKEGREEVKYMVTFKVIGTRDQITGLREYMESHKITFERS